MMAVRQPGANGCPEIMIPLESCQGVYGDVGWPLVRGAELGAGITVPQGSAYGKGTLQQLPQAKSLQ